MIMIRRFTLTIVGATFYLSAIASDTGIVDCGKSWNYNHLEIYLTLKSLTPGSTYSFGEPKAVDETEYLPLMCDGERTGMLMRQDGLKVYVRFEKGNDV